MIPFVIGLAAGVAILVIFGVLRYLGVL